MIGIEPVDSLEFTTGDTELLLIGLEAYLQIKLLFKLIEIKWDLFLSPITTHFHFDQPNTLQWNNCNHSESERTQAQAHELLISYSL